MENDATKSEQEARSDDAGMRKHNVNSKPTVKTVVINT